MTCYRSKLGIIFIIVISTCSSDKTKFIPWLVTRTSLWRSVVIARKIRDKLGAIKCREVHLDLSVVDLHADRETLGEVQRRRLDETVARALAAFSEGLGLVYVVGYGLDDAVVQRQYDIASVFFDGVDDEEKRQYVAKIAEEGSWAGYKVSCYV